MKYSFVLSVSIRLYIGLTTSVMLPPVALELAFASLWTNSKLWNWVPAGQKWGLQNRSSQHWTNTWSEGEGPSVQMSL